MRPGVGQKSLVQLSPLAGIGKILDQFRSRVDGQTNTDESGRFSFRAIVGFNYTVVDIRTDEAVMASEVHFSGSDRRRPITIKLVPQNR